MNTNKFGIIGLEFSKVIEEIRQATSSKKWWDQDFVIDLTPVLSVLRHCHLKEDYVFEAVPPEYDGMSVPYVRYKSMDQLIKKKYPGITSVDELPELYLSVDDAFEEDDCSEGVWEAFLLMDIDRHLPCIQHGFYGCRDFILDLDTYVDTVILGDYIDIETGVTNEEKIQEHLKKIAGEKDKSRVHGYETEEDIRMALALRGCPLLLPKVDTGRSRVYVTSWVPWAGMFRETYKYKRINNSYGFLRLNCESLTSYFWGIQL